jgi:PAS domain S-box-containing protein
MSSPTSAAEEVPGARGAAVCRRAAASIVVFVTAALLLLGGTVGAPRVALTLGMVVTAVALLAGAARGQCATLRARAERYAAIIDALGEGIIVRDGHGRLLDANPAAIGLTGLTREQLRSSSPSADTAHLTLVQEDGAPADDRALAAVLGLPSSAPRRQVMGVRDDGRLRWLLVQVDHLDAADAVVTSLVDVTAQVVGGPAHPVVHRRPVRTIDQAVRDGSQASLLLPVCMHCKSIRTDAGDWEPLEAFFTARAPMLFSHGVCPACEASHYPPAQS